MSRTVFPKLNCRRMWREATQSVMDFHVLRLRHYLHVFTTVIELITIKVVDAFKRFQFPAEVFFHNNAVFEATFPVNGYPFVASRTDITTSVRSLLRKVRVAVTPNPQVMFIAQLAFSSRINAVVNHTVHRPMYTTGSFQW